MKRFIHSFICIASFIAPVSVANACSCAPPKSVESHIANTEVIFRGIARWTTVKDEEDILASPAIFDNQATTGFEVIEVWKGPAITNILVNHNIDTGMCGIIFQKDNTYLVFASFDEDGNIHTSDCYAPYYYDYREGPRNYERVLKTHPSKTEEDLSEIYVK